MKQLYAIDDETSDNTFLVWASSEASAWSFFAKECLGIDNRNGDQVAGYSISEPNVLEAP